MYLRVAALSVVLNGCYFVSMPKSVPRIEQPTHAEDAFLEVETDVKNVRQGYTEKIEVCPKGSRSGCTDERRQKSRTVAVNTARATVDGNPISVGAVAMAASEEFRSDTAKLRSVTSSCKRGRMVMTVGGLGLSSSFFLLNVGFADPPNRGAQIGGIAALGAGAALMALGRFVAGGQNCDEAKSLYRKWDGVYADPDATTVAGERAQLLESLAKKFNRRRREEAPTAKLPIEDEATEEP